LNKIDRLRDPQEAFIWLDEFERATPISARSGAGIPALLTAIENELYENLTELSVLLPYSEGRLISLFYEHGLIENTSHDGEAVSIEGRIPERYTREFAAYTASDPDVAAGSADEV
jgi:GTP-binding protein HflX